MGKIHRTKPFREGRRCSPDLPVGTIFRLDGDLRRIVRCLPAIADPDADVIVTRSVQTQVGSRRYPLLAMQARDVEAALGSARVAHEYGQFRQAPAPPHAPSITAPNGEGSPRLDPG